LQAGQREVQSRRNQKETIGRRQQQGDLVCPGRVVEQQKDTAIVFLQDRTIDRTQVLDTFRELRVGMEGMDDVLHCISRCERWPSFWVSAAQVENELRIGPAVF
jgi:hypothetical protein